MSQLTPLNTSALCNYPETNRKDEASPGDSAIRIPDAIRTSSYTLTAEILKALFKNQVENAAF